MKDLIQYWIELDLRLWFCLKCKIFSFRINLIVKTVFRNIFWNRFHLLRVWIPRFWYQKNKFHCFIGYLWNAVSFSCEPSTLPNTYVKNFFKNLFWNYLIFFCSLKKLSKKLEVNQLRCQNQRMCLKLCMRKIVVGNLKQRSSIQNVPAC